ncbi:winged helix-turn-helix domain-containing protein [Naumannella huperziae]
MRLRLSQARRIALAAQGFGAARPACPVGMRDVQREITRLGQFQIDSINVVTRAHFMPLFSRLGPYDPALLERAAHRPPRRLFEYWGHAASLIDVTLQPALRWRMARAADEAWGSMIRIREQHPGLVERIRADVLDSARPITARQIEHDEVRVRDHWGWNWSSVKTACEWLFWAGEITSARRNTQFERAYAAPERVLPSSIIEAPTPGREEAIRELVRRSARALGIGTLACLADYFRVSTADAATAVAELEAGGELVPAWVEGWDRPLWLWHDARRPRRILARALVSPFDSLIFERRRLRELFGIDYTIEIYVPEAKRRYGYYVYPFLLGETFAARVDLKADRAAGLLRVRAAWLEPGHDPGRVAPELAAELSIMAGWLGLSGVAVEPRGDLAGALAVATG